MPCEDDANDVIRGLASLRPAGSKPMANRIDPQYAQRFGAQVLVLGTIELRPWMGRDSCDIDYSPLCPKGFVNIGRVKGGRREKGVSYYLIIQ